MVVYKITHIKSGLIYIGLTTRSITKRFKEHFRAAKHKKTPHKLYDFLKLHNLDHSEFNIEEIEKCNSLDELIHAEEKWIKVYNSVENGLNNVYGRTNTVNTKLVSLGLKRYWNNVSEEQKSQRNKKISEDKKTNNKALAHWKHVSEKKKHPLRLHINNKNIDFEDAHGPNGLKKYCVDNNLSFNELIKMAKNLIKQGEKFQCNYLNSDNNIIVTDCKRSKWKKTKYEKKIYKQYSFINPSGQEIIISNLCLFCKENNLCIVNMHRVLSRKQKTHKGWTIKK